MKQTRITIRHICNNVINNVSQTEDYAPKCHQHTKKSTIQNQIDYFLINNRNSIQKAFPEADVQYDHNPLVAVFNAKLWQFKRK